jgi:hypothetical protein
MGFCIVIGKPSLSNCRLRLAVEPACPARASCSGTASHLNCVEDLDGVDIRLLAPTIGIAFGQRTACDPFSMAAGRDALGPEGARRMRGEMDHETVRIDIWFMLLRLCTLPLASVASNLMRTITPS